MKTYTITLDEFTKELVLNALMEKAYGCDGQAKDSYLRAYGGSKRSKRSKRSRRSRRSSPFKVFKPFKAFVPFK